MLIYKTKGTLFCILDDDKSPTAKTKKKIIFLTTNLKAIEKKKHLLTFAAEYFVVFFCLAIEFLCQIHGHSVFSTFFL